MAERTTQSHGFGIEPLRTQPVARISPEELVKVIGAILKLDGRASFSDDGEDLTYAWVFLETPLGSTVETLVATEDDGSVVTFTPDITGPYTIGLTVSTQFRDSEQVTALVEIQAAVVPYTAQLTPDASWIYSVISDFWTLVEDRKVYETLWSGYTQLIAADLMRAFQVDYAKSIKDIQLLYQRRWIAYEPRLDLAEFALSSVFGFEQSGDTAFTRSSSDISVGLIISDREFLLTENTPSADAVGTDLQVFSSTGVPGNVGTYLINRINTKNDGYIVSAATPFIDPNEEVILEGPGLITFSLNPVVRTATDLVAGGVNVGDFLRIKDGVDAGYVKITKVGTPDGLTNDMWMEVETPPTATKTDVNYSVLRTVKASFQRSTSPNTDTVYILEDDADLTAYETASFSGTGTIDSTFEILVESRHVFDAIVGQTIEVLSGINGGVTFSIAAVNSSRTGYIIGSRFEGPDFPQTVTYQIPVIADISSRVLVLDGDAYEILSAVLDTVQPSVADGGRGPLWVITLADKTAPSNREGLEWRIAHSLVAEEADFPALGLLENDLLVLEVERQDTQQRGQIPCRILGAVGNKIAFTFGSDEVDVGEEGTLNDEEVLLLLNDLQVPAATEDVNGDLILTDTAEEIQVLLNSTGFQTDNFNLPVTSETDINLDAFVVRFSAGWVIRNCRIPVDETVISVPALFQFIAEPEVGEDANGAIILVGKDGSEVVLNDVPLVMLENRDYTVGDEKSIAGENAATVAFSDILTIPLGDLLDRDIRIGDVVDLTSGFDQDRYVILQVVDDENLKVLSENGELPSNTDEDLNYVITRRTPGKFVRFGEGLFSPGIPAPDRLWAETTFFDNTPYIEDNFGALVGVTKEQVDEFGTSQVSYRGVVAGLMYAWASGPTLTNAAVGAHLLLGLPVTEVLGVVIDIDNFYSEGVGRIMIEDLDSEGEGTGLVRIFFYTPEGTAALPEFAGLSDNPEAGRPWEVDDVVPALTPLSNGVVVDDYLSDPQWWTIGGSTGADELRKFHTWQAAVDVRQIDSRDISLVADFLLSIRPTYTKPEVNAILFLQDDVVVEDDFSMEGELFLFDDPAFSLESTHMVDSTAGSVPLRILDVGSLALRTLFGGDDLEIAAGSGTVTSARGGFLADGTLPYINATFDEPVTVAGAPLVRVGDLLFLPFGPNSGRFQVSAIPDDNTLEVVAYPDDIPPRTFDPAEFQEGLGVRFYVQRLDRNPIVSGTIDTAVGSDILEDATASLQWDGVAVDDTLIIEEGPDYGVYRIKTVGTFLLGNNVDVLTKITLDVAMTAAGTVAYRVEREALRTNPLVFSQASTVLGSQKMLVSGGLDLARLQLGDRVKMLSGADEGHVFRFLDAPDDNTLVVDEPLSATQGPVVYEVVRPLLDEVTPNSDFPFEKFTLYDDVEFDILHPRSVFLAVLDLTLAVDDATSAGTDLAAAGVTTAMVLEIDTFPYSGIYEIASVSTFTATVTPQFPVDGAGVAGAFLQEVADFSIAGDAVSSVALYNYETLGVLPGDVLRIAAGDFVIMVVSGSTLTLTQTTGLVAAVTGKIVRRVLP